MTTLFLALTLFSAPVNVDTLNAKTANQLAVKGSCQVYKELLHDTLKGIYAAAQEGFYRHNFRIDSFDEADYLRGKLTHLNYGVTVTKDGDSYPPWIVTVRW